MEIQKTIMSQRNPEGKKKNGTGGSKLLGFRLFYKGTIIKTVRH